jgi:hypothetical protein
MAAHRNPRGRAAGALVVMAFGCMVASLGAWHLAKLRQTHVYDEVLYRGSPQTLLLWLASLDFHAPTSAERIAERLLLMPLPQRREAVLALAGNEIWTRLARSPGDVRSWQQVMLTAVKQAVARAPMAGDLWFLAGTLAGQLSGYGEASQRALALSATYAPREPDLVEARLAVLAPAWPLLDEALRDVVRRDLAVAGLASPEQARAIRETLERAGAQLDG